MTMIHKLETRFESGVIFNELVEPDRFPNVTPRYRMKAKTLDEAIRDMEKRYDNNELSMWTAWIIFQVDYIFTVDAKDEADAAKNNYSLNELASSMVNSVVHVRYRDGDEFQKKADVIAAKKKQDDESGLTALYAAYDEESKENHHRQYYDRVPLLPRRAEVAYKTFTGETVPFDALESVRKADRKENRWWKKLARKLFAAKNTTKS